MISASLDFVSSAMWRTAALMVAMSPLPVLPRVTPQSMRICCGPSFDGMVTRKKSPKPTRYIRIRSSAASMPAAAPLVRSMSEAPVRDGEVDLKPVRIVALHEAEALVVAALPRLTGRARLPVEALGDDVPQDAVVEVLAGSF